MHTCYLCQSNELVELIDLGMQPISNRFLKDAGEKDYVVPLGISQCTRCGLVQISEPVSAKDLRPAYDWITYNEPEPHLDSLAQTIANLPDLKSGHGIWGVSFKDDSLLRRMEKLGFPNTYRLDPARDLEIEGVGAGAETIQERMEVGRMARILDGRSKPQVVIARHIIEHAHDFRKFISALIALVQPGGYLVLEAPDCQRAFELFDYTTIWEEHTIYFTPPMFRAIFPNYGMSTQYFEVFPYAFENSIVGIGKVDQNGKTMVTDTKTLDVEITRMKRYTIEMPEQSRRFKQFFERFIKEKGQIALFGAGHLACAFINYLNLKEYVAFVADDNPHKQGLFMPGSGIPIRPSSHLLEENVRLALFSLSPEVEDKVVAKNQTFIDHGGQFASIFPASKRAIAPKV